MSECGAVPSVVLEQSLTSGEGPAHALGHCRDDISILPALLHDMWR